MLRDLVILIYYVWLFKKLDYQQDLHKQKCLNFSQILNKQDVLWFLTLEFLMEPY